MHMAVMVQALREVPLDAIECYPLVAVVMPTAIYVQKTGGGEDALCEVLVEDFE